MGLALRDVRNFARERAGRHLPLSSVRPVTFPSGRAKLPTRPTRSGSATATNTVGMVVLVRPLPQRSLASLRQPSHRRSDVRTLVRGHTIARGAVHPAQLDLNALAPVRHQRNHRHEHGNAGDRAILASCTIAGPGRHPGKPFALFAGTRTRSPAGGVLATLSDLKRGNAASHDLAELRAALGQRPPCSPLLMPSDLCPECPRFPACSRPYKHLLLSAKTVRHCNAAIFPFRRLFDDLVGERSP